MSTAASIQRAVEHLDRHYARPITVAGLAGMCRLSRAHFIRTFRAHVRETPHQYLRARRIARARELLVRTPMPVTEICEAVGFRSLGSFSSLFRRLTGESPAAYRAKRRRPPIIPGCFLKMHRLGR
jgi:transcriptional regulator GlxA family with amidase domain